MSTPKQRKEFCEKIRNPYYGRPIVIQRETIGSQFILMVQKTGEAVAFICHSKNCWYVYGDQRKLTEFTLQQVENLLADYWHLADSDNNIFIDDPMGMTYMTMIKRDV